MKKLFIIGILIALVQVVDAANFRIATSGGGESGYSNEVTGPCETECGLEWDRPTTWTDDTPLSVREIDYYTLYWGISSGTYTNNQNVYSATSYTLATGITESVFIVVTATASVKAAARKLGAGQHIKLQ